LCHVTLDHCGPAFPWADLAAAGPGGGKKNLAEAEKATIDGGEKNYIPNTGTEAWIVGGLKNKAEGEKSSVSGGLKNHSSGLYSSILGGEKNTASGEGSSASGGEENTALPTYSSILGGKKHEAKLSLECIPSCP
jgi:hypothetical protein